MFIYLYRLSVLKNERNDLKHRLHSAEQIIYEYQRTNADDDDAKTQIRTMLQEKINHLEGMCKENETTICAMKASLKNNEDEVLSMMLKCTSLEREKAEFADKEAIIRKQEQQINNLKAENTQLENDCLQKRNTIIKQAARIYQVVDQKRLSNLRQMTEETDELHKTKQKLESTIRELDETRLRFYVHIFMYLCFYNSTCFF